MTVLAFVDSSVLVYRHDRGAPSKQARSQELLSLLWSRRCGRLSVQVLHELAEDLQDGQEFDGVTVVNPYTHDVQALDLG